MIILGIDPGFSFTGYAVVKLEGHKAVLIDYGYLRLPSGKSLVERVGTFHTFFDAKIKDLHISELSIETPFLGKNAQNFLKLGYLRGILYLLANKNNLNLLEFAPREIKQRLTGFGGASKDQVARVVSQLFPGIKDLGKDDVTDAVAITLCGLWKQSNPYSRLLN